MIGNRWRITFAMLVTEDILYMEYQTLDPAAVNISILLKPMRHKFSFLTFRLGFALGYFFLTMFPSFQLLAFKKTGTVVVQYGDSAFLKFLPGHIHTPLSH